MKKKNKNLAIGIIISLILIASLIFIVSNQTLQSVFSLDKVSVGNDGKVYWVVTATADSIDEKYEFNYLPSKYTKTDGTTITPKTTMDITFSKKQSYCEYTLLSEEYKGINYKILSNPQRVANIYIRTNKGNLITLDGTTTQSRTIGDLTVKTQGIIAGKTDCPNYENVIIVEDKIYDKDNYKNFLDSACNWYDLACIIRFASSQPEITENTQFISAFNDYPVVTSNEVRGNIELGNGIFTITASEDYFNSVTVYPADNPNPEIDSINIPSEIKSGETSSMKVIISNKNTDNGIINVKATSDDLSIYPSSTNIELDDKVTLDFIVTANDNIGSNEICIEASSTGQFGTSNTDKECKSFKIVREIPEEYCGDGICQNSESYTTCSEDCIKPEECSSDSDCENGYECIDEECILKETTCQWFEQSYEKDVKVWNWYNILSAGLIKPEVVTERGCKTAGWFSWLVIGTIITILGSVAIVTLPKIKRK